MGQTTCSPLSVGHTPEMVVSEVPREKDQVGCESVKYLWWWGGSKEPLKGPHLGLFRNQAFNNVHKHMGWGALENSAK